MHSEWIPCRSISRGGRGSGDEATVNPTPSVVNVYINVCPRKVVFQKSIIVLKFGWHFIVSGKPE